RERIEKNHAKLTASEAAIIGILTRLYSDYARRDFGAKDVTNADRELLRKELAWFGELALAPAGGPDAKGRDAVLEAALQTTFRATIAGGLILMIVVAGLAGVALSVIVFV